jgi:ABC-2 type transport system permease protein
VNFRRLKAIAKKEFLHILRDWRSLVLALAMPLTMLLLFGYALTLDVDRIPTYVYDWDQTPESRDLIQQFRASRYFTIIDAVNNYGAIERGIDENKATIALAKGYSRDLLAGREAEVQILLDGSDSNTASIAQGYAQAIVQTYAAKLRSDAQVRRGGGELRAAIDPRIRVWYNSELKSRNFIIPGLIAVTLMIIAAMLTSLTIAREWENGTMEQLLSTPVRPAELVLGKLLAFFALGLIDMLICVSVGVFVFQVPFRGSAWFLFFTCCIFLFGALAWGILVSAMARTQLFAYQLGLLSSFLPAFLLSGFIFAIGNMPRVIQAMTYVVPTRYFVAIINGIFLKGVGLSMLWGETTLLALYALVVFAAAIRKMRLKVA